MNALLRGGMFQAVALVAVLSAARALPQTASNGGAPLPSAAELKQRVLANWKNLEAEQERYICKTNSENDITDKNGRVKTRDTRQYDLFFVNGQEIDELTAKNGKPLDASQQKKEMARVQQQIKKDSDSKYVAKENAGNEKLLDTLLKMLRFTHGRRIEVNGRATLAYDLSGDPGVHPHGTVETFTHNMVGTIQVDEATGELVDLNAKLDHDVRVGGGLLANLHKGLWVHVRVRRYPDGVWLPNTVEGNGDARAALFFHPFFKFRETMNGCVLTSVTTSQKAPSIAR